MKGIASVSLGVAIHSEEECVYKPDVVLDTFTQIIFEPDIEFFDFIQSSSFESVCLGEEIFSLIDEKYPNVMLGKRIMDAISESDPDGFHGLQWLKAIADLWIGEDVRLIADYLEIDQSDIYSEIFMDNGSWEIGRVSFYDMIQAVASDDEDADDYGDYSEYPIEVCCFLSFRIPSIIDIRAGLESMSAKQIDESNEFRLNLIVKSVRQGLGFTG